MIQTAVLVKPGEIRLEQRLACAPAPGEAAVSVCCVGLCGTDLAMFQGKWKPDQPVIPGHEFSGRVFALGDGVTSLQIGQKVSIAPLISCGSCEFCRSGFEYLCQQRRIFGFQLDGALRQRVNLPANIIFPLPESISLREGALLEPLAVAVHAVQQAGDLKRCKVAIIGAGAIGLLIAQAARASGASSVVLLDINPERLTLARELGFTAHNTSTGSMSWFDETASAGGFECLFEASGAPAAVEHLPGLLKPRGTIVIVGRFPSPVLVDLDTLLLKEAKMVTSRYFSLSDYRDALQLAAAGNVRLEPLIQAETFFERLADRQGADVFNAACRVVRLLVAFKTEI